jgi:hypothetical protein
MNAASNKVRVKLSNGEAIEIQVIHLSNPLVSKENPSSLAEDYCVISEDGRTEAFLFRVASRSPLTIEQLDTDSPEGRLHWQRVDAYLRDRE